MLRSHKKLGAGGPPGSTETRERDSKSPVELCLPFLSLLCSSSSVSTEYVCSLEEKQIGGLLAFVHTFSSSKIPPN